MDIINFSNNLNIPDKNVTYEDKTIKKDDSISAQTETLKKLYEIKEPSSTLSKLISKCRNILEFCLISLNERTLESYRTQEHLIQGTCSWYGTQINAFKSHFSLYDKSDGLEFVELHKELSNGVVDVSDLLIRKFMPGGEKKWADKIKDKIENLKPNESLLIDASSMKGFHSMLMRITKNENGSFDLQFANSGTGLDDNEDFHPKEVGDSKGVQRQQLVAVIKNIDKSKLLGDFFEDFARVSEGKKPQSIPIILKSSPIALSNTKTVENIETINQMYGALRGLGNPETMTEKKYYNREQITYSCGASCVWAMTNTILNEKQSQQVGIDMKMKALIHHYKQMKTGYDLSSTRKIMILDLVQSLKKECSDFESNPINLLIEKEIKEKLNIDMKQDPEVKISNSSKVKIDKFLEKDKQGDLKLRSFKMKISPAIQFISGLNVTSSLVAHLSMSKVSDGEVYNMKKDGAIITGQKCADAVALLCFNVANADYKECQRDMDSIMDKLKKINSGNIKESKRNIKACNLLASLASEFKFDNTRSGIAKQKYLSLLSLHIFCSSCGVYLNKFDQELPFTPENPDHMKKLIKLMQMQSNVLGLNEEEVNCFNATYDCLEHSNLLYRNLEVEKYLSEDNIWLNGLNSLTGNITVPKKPEEPKKLESTSEKGHITDQNTVSEWLNAPTNPEAAVNSVAKDHLAT